MRTRDAVPTNARRIYTATGVLLALGAPVGWLALRYATGAAHNGIDDELAAHSALYAYLLFGTATAFGLAGAAAGMLADRLQVANARLLSLATTDGLTGLKNPRAFHELLAVECARANRDGAPLALVMVDLDHFKLLNDRHGHAVGDVALAHAASIIAAAVRAGDVACRVGGEEFVVICPSCDRLQATIIADRIRATLEQSPVRTTTGAERLTASCGVAEYVAGEGAASFYRRVDAAMYAAKTAGRNRAVVAKAPLIAAAEGARRR